MRRMRISAKYANAAEKIFAETGMFAGLPPALYFGLEIDTIMMESGGSYPPVIKKGRNMFLYRNGFTVFIWELKAENIHSAACRRENGI